MQEPVNKFRHGYEFEPGLSADLAVRHPIPTNQARPTPRRPSICIWHLLVLGDLARAPGYAHIPSSLDVAIFIQPTN